MSRDAVPMGSPLPVLQAKRGWAALDTWTRSRFPALNVIAVGHIRTPMRHTPSGPGLHLPGSTLSTPSLMLRDRPDRSTWHKRTKTSKWGRLERSHTSASTGPATVISLARGDDVYTS